ncbi:MAG: DNA repair protein RadC [Paludibacteraceae bacterium]
MSGQNSIKNWAEDDRPREKLMTKGNESLSNAELLAILIGSGNKDESAVELSKRILSSVENNLNELGRCTVRQLTTSFLGIGEAKAVSIIAALELGRRRKHEEVMVRPSIKMSSDIYDMMHPLLADLLHEELWILLLNRTNRVLAKKRLFVGGLSSTVFDVKVAVKEALDAMSNGVVLVHNHPSGGEKPSSQDKEITSKMKTACSTMDLTFLDHLIVAQDKYFSFADEGLLL